MAVIRVTLGWNRERWPIARRRLQALTGIDSKNVISHTLSSLERKKVILVSTLREHPSIRVWLNAHSTVAHSEGITGNTLVYGPQLDVSRWPLRASVVTLDPITTVDLDALQDQAPDTDADPDAPAPIRIAPDSLTNGQAQLLVFDLYNIPGAHRRNPPWQKLNTIEDIQSTCLSRFESSLNAPKSPIVCSRCGELLPYTINRLGRLKYFHSRALCACERNRKGDT
jgi:hypothetical protein